MLMRLMSKGAYLIVPKGTKFTGAGKLGLKMENGHISFSATVAVAEQDLKLQFMKRYWSLFFASDKHGIYIVMRE